MTTLNISNFDTSKATDMEFLFYNLTNLESIDISNFNIHNIESLEAMFYNCEKLISLNISFLDTSNIKDFSYLFYGCSSLTSLNLLNMNTSSAIIMDALFYNCYNLETLDLINFDTSLVTSMKWMFYGCHSLKSIKFPEIFNTSKVKTIYSMFNNCKSLTYLNLSSFDTSKVTDMSFMFQNCLNLKYLDIPHFSPLNLKRIRQMFYNMSSLIYLNIFSLDINEETTTNYAFDNLHSNIKICSNKTNMQNYLLNICRRYDCNDISYQENNDIILNKIKHIFSIMNNENNNGSFNIFYNGIQDDNHIRSYNLSDKSIQNELIFESIKGVLIDNYYKIKYDNDIEVHTKDLLITMTNTYNQNNKINKNRTTINLGECERKLIAYYNISENASLYILKLDAKEEGMKIPKIEYEIFYPLNDTDLIKLNLTICQNTRIDISIPVDINCNEIYKYNPNSDYYNDICLKATSDSNTDLSLSERKNEFIDKNMSLCEEDCYLIQYNSTSKEAKCSCEIKMNLPKIKDIKFDKSKLYKNFIDIKNIAKKMCLLLIIY